MRKQMHEWSVNQECVLIGLIGLLMAGCNLSELKPVDIFPEDACAQCRMAVSDRSFASEIITEDGEALKFDDLGCLENYRKKNPATKIRAIFVSDFDTKTWLSYEKSHIVKSGITTPMGSGRVAFGDSAKAAEFLKSNPPTDTSENEDGCGGDCSPSESDKKAGLL